MSLLSGNACAEHCAPHPANAGELIESGGTTHFRAMGDTLGNTPTSFTARAGSCKSTRD